MSLTRLTEIGALLADATRAEFLTVLMDGRARTGGELARHAGVAASTASQHLSRLQDAGLVVVEAQGRHRYFRLAGVEVAEMLEALGAVSAGAAPAPRAPAELSYARSCYDHLAGEVAVRLYDGMLGRGELAAGGDGLVLTVRGEMRLAGFGADVSALQGGSRPVARACLDWTERRHHLAGAAGNALFDALLARHWVARGQRPRSVLITDAGQRGLRDVLSARR